MGSSSFVLDLLHLGFLPSVRSFVRPELLSFALDFVHLGLVLFLKSLSQPESASFMPDHSHLGSFLSVHRLVHSDSVLPAFSLSRSEPEMLALDHVNLAFAFSIQSLT